MVSISNTSRELPLPGIEIDRAFNIVTLVGMKWVVLATELLGIISSKKSGHWDSIIAEETQ